MQTLPTVPDYDRRQDGTPMPDRVLAMLTEPRVLRARAAIRLAIADQDRADADTHAEWRNRMVAADMLERAERQG